MPHPTIPADLIERERKDFEAWWRSDSPERDWNLQRMDEFYAAPLTQNAWAGFLERAKVARREHEQLVVLREEFLKALSLLGPKLRPSLSPRENALFESWFPASGRDPAWLTKRADGTYMAPIYQAAWDAWTACAFRDVEVTEEMVEIAAREFFMNDWPHDKWERMGTGVAARRYREGAGKALTAALKGEA